ncbi:type II secretion system F family protein [Granulosicoccus sp. 3-233]|uniref:type II secretion system F family protein n=1 Tax=Granulosicoccus sp. 3-233 TaxID=3417969 RepID=UPI003D3346C4
MLYGVLAVLFISFTLVIYYGLHTTTEAVDQYSQKFSVTAESNMRKLFLFADARKLSMCYIAAIVVVPPLLYVLGFGLVISSASLLILFLAPRWLFARLAERRRVRINQSLPDALTQISGAMRAGSTFTMAMQSYVDEETGPLGQEFSLLLREQRVGARLEDALDSLAERVQSEEMDLVVSAALIANDIGGNLAEILQSLAETIRRKLEMEGKVASLTAQGRLQGFVVSALPFAILVPLTWFEPEATLPIFNSLLGWLFLTVIVFMVCIGGLIIRKIVNVDI